MSLPHYRHEEMYPLYHSSAKKWEGKRPCEKTARRGISVTSFPREVHEHALLCAMHSEMDRVDEGNVFCEKAQGLVARWARIIACGDIPFLGKSKSSRQCAAHRLHPIKDSGMLYRAAPEYIECCTSAHEIEPRGLMTRLCK